MESKDVLIIRELTIAEGDFVSGSQLAELAGVSRVAIHGHMEKLRAQGFEFEAVRSKGYRLTKRPDNLNQTLVQALLTHAASSLKVFVFDQIDSTNSEAERRLAMGEETPFVILARQQNAGRGRLGRVWHSAQNGNVYSTFAFRPEVSPTRMALFTLWMGVNLCECLNALCRIQCGVKWPNDLHIDGKKIAGILTEARMETDQVRDVVLGVGLNLNSQAADWPEELRQVATSLRERTGRPLDVNRTLAAIAGRIMIAYRQFLDDDHRALLKDRWPRYDTLRDKPISLLQGDAHISGIARGIDLSGALVIEREDGTRYHARAGEVTIEKSSSQSA